VRPIGAQLSTRAEAGDEIKSKLLHRFSPLTAGSLNPTWGQIGTATRTNQAAIAKRPISDPAMLVPADIGEIFLAGSLIDQTDDECPHDRTPLLDRGSIHTRALFLAGFVRFPKWFRWDPNERERSG
jgi:hypothetical protein